MASCLVPDFPAVMVALEHLKDLEKQLNEEGVLFSTEANLHLAEMSTAITHLEKDRRDAHERLEVETIENSKLRHHIHNICEQMNQVIVADVAEAQASNAEEMETFLGDLTTVSQLCQVKAQEQEVLSNQNRELHLHLDQVKAEQKEIVAALNERVSLKYDLQTQLDQKQEHTEELKSCIAAVKQEKAVAKQSAALERESFTLKRDQLSSREREADEHMKQQKQANRRSRRHLDRVKKKKQDVQGRLGGLQHDLAKLESSLQRLTASRGQFEKHLEVEDLKHHSLKHQEEMLQHELCELADGFKVAIQHLKEHVSTAQGSIEEGHLSRSLGQEQLAHVSERFRCQRDEENQVAATHFQASLQLEQSKLRLDERITSVVKRGKEINDMDKQIRDLQEADTVNKQVFQKNQDDLCCTADSEKKNICHLEEEKSRLWRLLERTRNLQEEYLSKVTSEIRSTRTRHEKLRQEEAALLELQPESADPELLQALVAQCAAEYRQIQLQHQQEIQRCFAEMENIAVAKQKKVTEVEEKEETLREMEAKCNGELSQYRNVEILTAELEQKKAQLELGIQSLKEKTRSLLQPKEDMKSELENMRTSHMDAVEKQASELKAVETTVYDYGVKLDQVLLENSRLRLCIRQMSEDLSRAAADRERYTQVFQRCNQDQKALYDDLQEAWRDDLSVTEQSQSRDRDLLESLSSLLSHLKTKSQLLGRLESLLHWEMFNFSRRLGDKTTAHQQSGQHNSNL